MRRVGRVLQVRLTSEPSRRKLERLYQRLRGTKLKDGTVMRMPGDALAWLLERHMEEQSRGVPAYHASGQAIKEALAEAKVVTHNHKDDDLGDLLNQFKKKPK